ncbi:GNAT family N-acetyltransferase [Vibrio methylphosphonaticus]|uniref:GNAT family N-acetyltransferase n=1 Tax=Vibrio methylphosphonaticus TaxID=2946866 RepID=UPI00202A1156|nr:GNAT family N-acetyltransferase [Vibrio methylphosphonaticus]MCL9774968.1 GNAT family N-acetyltransferase [Vibrio methylphosphonaticus]
MKISIESRRLHMRQINASDECFFRALHRDKRVTHLCFDTPTDAEIQHRFVQRLPPWNITASHWLCLTIVEQETGKKIGFTGFIIEDDKAEVGYLITPDCHGYGYATESLQALLTWAQSHLPDIGFEATVTDGNTQSERVLSKCGFTQIKRVPDAFRINGHWHDDVIYAR